MRTVLFCSYILSEEALSSRLCLLSATKTTWVWPDPAFLGQPRNRPGVMCHDTELGAAAGHPTPGDRLAVQSWKF